MTMLPYDRHYNITISPCHHIVSQTNITACLLNKESNPQSNPSSTLSARSSRLIGTITSLSSFGNNHRKAFSRKLTICSLVSLPRKTLFCIRFRPVRSHSRAVFCSLFCDGMSYITQTNIKEPPLRAGGIRSLQFCGQSAYQIPHPLSGAAQAVFSLQNLLQCSHQHPLSFRIQSQTFRARF